MPKNHVNLSNYRLNIPIFFTFCSVLTYIPKIEILYDSK